MAQDMAALQHLLESKERRMAELMASQGAAPAMKQARAACARLVCVHHILHQTHSADASSGQGCDRTIITIVIQGWSHA